MGDTWISRPQSEWAIKLSEYICLPQRYILALMVFFSSVNAFTMRICLSMVMPALVVPRNYTAGVETEAQCPPSENIFPDDEVPHTGTYDWSQSEQGLVLSSFYIGYVITHIPGGELSKVFGGKWVLNSAIFFTVICTMVTPLTIKYAENEGLIVIRILMGGAQGFLFPAISDLIGQWIPKRERTSIGTIMLSGPLLGIIAANLATGFILGSYDWPIVFYIYGFIGLIWCIVFTFLCFSDPISHPYIKPKEKEYLLQEMGAIGRRTDLGSTPWKAIFTNVPVWAMIITEVGHDWSFYILVTDLPKYLNDVMQIPIKKNAIFASLPFALMLFAGITSSFISDIFIRKNILSITMVRKINTFLSAIGPAVFGLLASYSGCNEILVLLNFVLCLATFGLFVPGVRLTPVDLSPNYAGTLMALSNGIGALGGFLAPYSVGVMTPNTTIKEWRMVFWLSGTILVLSTVVFCIWGSGEIQTWNDPNQQAK